MRPQVRPRHEAHGEVEHALLLATAMDGHDVRVLERRARRASVLKRAVAFSSSIHSGAISFSATARSRSTSIAL
jgi:hypothetical protein